MSINRSLPVRVCVLFPFLGSGCASWHYDRVRVGSLNTEAVIALRWISPDEFMFVPDPDPAKRLRFTRADGTVIEIDRAFLTDGGSIPRLLWVLEHYSPWGYAPAFVIHDWLFERHHANAGEPYASISLNDAAWIMSEIMKTLMVTEPEKFPTDKSAVYVMHLAVDSVFAKRYWDGTVNSQKVQKMRLAVPPGQIIAEWVIEADGDIAQTR